MNYEELAKQVLEQVGGRENVTSVTNCMTRLRIKVRDGSAINSEALKKVKGVLGIIHDRENYIEVVVGPGKSSKCGEVCRRMGIPTADAEPQGTNAGRTAANAEGKASGRDWRENKEAVKAMQKENPVRNALKIFGEIFVPLIPGVIASGSFLTYLTAWTGYRAAERFGGTPILGGMLGMITGLDGINLIAQTIGWWNESSPLDSMLRSGRGGILAVVFGVLIMTRVEKWIRSHIPDALDVVFTPVLTLIACLIPYIFVIMPLFGLISGGICFAVQSVCMSPNVWVRAITGYVSAALFLPMVAMGMHHGLVALYTVQLQQMGYITLYPALCMAGAGQVGAALAIWFKAKRVKNDRLSQIISGALPAGILGVGEPLIYGVTLPMGRPFITAGLGAGFGGAFVMAMQVAATTWGPSGLLGVFTMTAGPHAGIRSVVYYLIGLLISCGMAFFITGARITDNEVEAA